MNKEFVLLVYHSESFRKISKYENKYFPSCNAKKCMKELNIYYRTVGALSLPLAS